ncbi:MAG: phage tail sheath C-terminal domain-containing protein [Bacteroidota bacterium]
MMNANNPQTPGVYTVEKSAFPNSVAEVPTAIPAWVGYTEKAVLNGKPLNKPLLINSMAEYQQHFGGPFTNKYPITQVNTSTDPVTKQKIIPPYDFEITGKYYKINEPGPGNMFYLYNCLQLFYQNGGGPCYIMSIGNYEIEVAATPPATGFVSEINEPDKDHFLTGLEELPKIQFPKPTMIMTPDSLLLSSADYFTVQEQVLMQCGELEDRVGMIDIYNGYKDMSQGVISNFRNKIGNNYLKYGITYYPFLETTIVEAKDMTYANVDQSSQYAKTLGAKQLSEIFIGESALGALATITEDLESVANLAATPPMDFSAAVPPSFPGATATGTAYPSWRTALNAFPGGDSIPQMLSWQLNVVFTMAWTLYTLGKTKTLAAQKVSISNTQLVKAVAGMTNPLGNVIGQLIGLYGYDTNFISTGTTPTPLGVLTLANLAKIGVTPTTNPKLNNPSNPYGTTTEEGEMYNMAESAIKRTFSVLLNAINQVSTTAQTLLDQYNSSLENSNPNYKTLMSALAQKAGTLPPSAAMAGVYTLVDNTEGVWIAPANRNINSVTAPTVTINDDQQASLNVDALAGKSVNAIRSFYGIGPAIIWGARTLDGNSQDWRYINVRRTTIAIEQSIANAAQSLVFQPNDASTWNNCESMINNYLHNLWSEGALQGSSPAAAYNVSVGLGKTMTGQDVLNGIMRVEVKLALVRPAEFIIITYEQEMPTS